MKKSIKTKFEKLISLEAWQISWAAFAVTMFIFSFYKLFVEHASS